MFAFLLAWMAGKESKRRHYADVVLIAMALASAFGLSIYVAFAFFLVMLVWAFWQVVIEHTPLPVLFLAAGGVGAVLLLLPYLWELTHTKSRVVGGSLFAFSVREMIPPDGLLAFPAFQHLVSHTEWARNLAELILLAPGYAVELGFYFPILLIYLIPSLRGRSSLTEKRSLILIAYATSIHIVREIRSAEINDFGWRGALLVQFPLLLLASEMMTGWNLANRNQTAVDFSDRPHKTPSWLRSIAAFALVIGLVSTLPSDDAAFRSPSSKRACERPMTPSHDSSHNVYASNIGYAQLDASIPQNAIVQSNPSVRQNQYWDIDDMLGVDHQIVISTDQPWCGAELGGDPNGCRPMAVAIDSSSRCNSGAGAYDLPSVRYPISRCPHYRSCVERQERMGLDAQTGSAGL